MIEEKRKELEQFLQEQLIGPGGCAGRFGKVGMVDGEEILNTTPGSIYYTGILFPKKAEDDARLLESEEYSENEEEFSLERRFPNAMAISCCLNEKVDLKKDVKIRITGRYYRRINKEEYSNVYVKINEDRQEILLRHLQEMGENINELFSFKNGRLSLSLLLTNTAKSQYAAAIDEIDKKWAKQIQQRIAEKPWGESVVSLADKNLFLSSCRRRLFEKLRGNLQDADEIKQLIEDIGQREQSLHDMQDLLNFFDKDRDNSYGFWESKPIEWNVQMGTIPFASNRRVYRYQEDSDIKLSCLYHPLEMYRRTIENSTIEITPSLSVLLQITKDTRHAQNHNKYLKVMLQNSTTPFIETQKDHYNAVNEEVNKSCFFGVKIEIESDYLEPYQKGDTYSNVTKEEDRLNFLYRNLKDYGVGHLCSVDWDKENHKKVWSTFLPKQDVPDVDFTPRNKKAELWTESEKGIVPPPFLENNDCLNFYKLSTFSAGQDKKIYQDLLGFVDQYQKWIDLLPLQESSNPKYQEFAEYTKKKCQEDCDRIRTNIEKILSDSTNMCSFRLMNSAMLMQIWHKEYTKDHDVLHQNITPEFYKDKGKSYYWRPFQLAFILLNLDGIIQRDDDPSWDRRSNYVDLVWFPTGGGKTEAYLGIIALTIINRRRRYDHQAGGTTAIMRYTLRLLATQQFERALNLIVALDQIRIWGLQEQYKDYYIGAEAVSIGLFVGKDSLPNKYEDLEREAQTWADRERPNVRTKIPLNKCPLCGETLYWNNRGKRKYWRNIATNRDSSFDNGFACNNEYCTYNRNPLPVQLCDEMIYAMPPTLLFGTVDKFAQLARKVSTGDDAEQVKKDSRRLFGTGAQIDYLTPDLIIQDELHLLLGPLGTAVGFYEGAIDKLCRRNHTNTQNEVVEIRPKIISSTATTRNTELQIRALYDRDVNIFPKSGVDYDDSFFAFYQRRLVDNKLEWISKRRYLGIMPTGRTQMYLQLQLAAILFVHRAKFEAEHWIDGKNDEEYSKAADNYFSILSYFNSLREVGKTDSQYPYEFTKSLQRLYKRVLGCRGILDCYYADENTLSSEELTGRLSGAEVVETLQKVQRKFNVVNRRPTPPDYILATNMISVGIDVSRFNTIIMNSMPRNTAEYIQASSRVARSEKGLVLTSHNPFRVRDVSHFEKFIEFHEKMYYYVDPISITPFSKKSLEKYLALYLATVIRHKINNRQDNKQAANLAEEDVERIVEYLMKDFERRYKQNSAISNEDKELEGQLKQIFPDLQVVRASIDAAILQWKDKSDQAQELWFYNDNQYNPHDEVLYTETEDYEDETEDSLWTVPNSLRIVEQETVLRIQNQY